MLYRADIQILRGLAVLIVFFYHLQVPGFANGYLGVDIFFVLSGYLMAQLYDQGTVYDFYSRRLKRLLPAYLVTLGITTLCVSFITIPSDAQQRFDRGWFDLLGLSNIVFWNENSYFSDAAFKPLLNLWSLGVELQYYLFVPFLLPLVKKYRWLLYVAIAGSMVCALFMTMLSPKTSFFMMPFRVWEFLLGALVAWWGAERSFSQGVWGKVVSCILVTAILGVMAFYPLAEEALNPLIGHPGLAAVLVSFVSAMILLKPLCAFFSNAHIGGRLLARIGDYSYSIYLVHFPIIVLMNYVPFGGTNLGFGSAYSLMMIVGLTAIFSYLMFHYVEKIRFSDRFKYYMAFIIFCTLTVLIVSPVINQSRFTPEQKLIFKAWSDRDVYRCGKLARVLNLFETVCKTGASSDDAMNVFLIGNSHADSIKRIFSDTLSDHDIGTYFYVANNPLMSPRTHHEALADDTKRLNVSAVVIHYSPSFYKKDEYRQALADFLDDMSQIDIDVILIAPVPHYKFQVPNVLYWQTVDANLSAQGMSLEEYKARNQEFFAWIVQNNIPDENIYWPVDYFCGAPRCMLEIDGKPLYFDSGHLTLTGAQQLRPLFEAIARKLMGSSS